MLTAQNNIDMREIEHNDRNSELVSQLVTVWEASVRATHTFLTNAQIEQIREYVPDALRGIEHLVVAFDGAQPVGFMGVDGQRLEMLFLSPRLPRSRTWRTAVARRHRELQRQRAHRERAEPAGVRVLRAHGIPHGVS